MVEGEENSLLAVAGRGVVKLGSSRAGWGNVS
jgi:hypothetical protein